MGVYSMLYGSADCFDSLLPAQTSLCPDHPHPHLDTLLSSLLVILVLVSVWGNCLVNTLFRVYHVIHTDMSVSHVCLAHLALSDLVYSVVVSPLPLALLLANSRFDLDIKGDVIDGLIYQIVGFAEVVCRRVSLLLLFTTSLHEFTRLYFPTFHRSHCSLVGVKTTVGAIWISSVIFGVLPFMYNSTYDISVEALLPSWRLRNMFYGSTAVEFGEFQPEVDKMTLIWAFLSCFLVPVLVPAVFTAVSSIVLILRLDLTHREVVSNKAKVAKTYDPFSMRTREMAIKIARGPGDIATLNAPSKSQNRKQIEEDFYRASSLESLRPILLTYILSSTLWYVADVNEIASVRTGHRIHGEDVVTWLPLVSVILFHVSLALTPILHFVCSGEMRRGLLAMLGGYSSVQEFEGGASKAGK